MGLIAERYKTGAVSVGAVKTNPLPPGRYWIDIFPPGVASWVGWSGGNLNSVSVEKTEIYQGTTKLMTFLGWIYPWVPNLADPANTPQPDRAFVIFNVSAPTPWTIAETVGYPNNAPKGIVNTSDDTIQKPDPYAERDEQFKWIKYSAYGLIGVVGLYSLAKLIRG